MEKLSFDLMRLEAWALEHPRLNWYAVADSAQHDAVPSSLLGSHRTTCCLFKHSQGSPAAQYSPHLVSLDPPAQKNKIWQWIKLNAVLKPCVSIIATPRPFKEIFDQLTDFIEVVLPDHNEMFLAFWDPAILGTLIGQDDDLTLHVKGPVLTKDQAAMLMNGLAYWGYWDRSGGFHAIRVGEKYCKKSSKIRLTQNQVDDLVEASVPDHILYFLRKNQQMLVNKVPIKDQYEIVRVALSRAREIGLFSMRDLINYVCVELYYEYQGQKSGVIEYIIDQIKNRGRELDQIIRDLP